MKWVRNFVSNLLPVIPPVIGHTGGFTHHIEKLFARVSGNRAVRRRKSKAFNAEVIRDVLDPEEVESVADKQCAVKAPLIHELRGSIHALLGAVPFILKQDGACWHPVVDKEIPA